MKLIILLTTVLLTGCGTYGEPLFLSAMYNAGDHCQRANWPNGIEPRYCGGARGAGGAVYVNGQYQGRVKITK